MPDSNQHPYNTPIVNQSHIWWFWDYGYIVISFGGHPAYECADSAYCRAPGTHFVCSTLPSPTSREEEMDRSQVRLRSARRNHHSVNQRSAMVYTHIQQEHQARCLIGPLIQSLVPLCQVSLIALVSKSQPGQWRLIVDLSFPECHSTNDEIAQDLMSIQYARLEDTVHMVRALG